MGSLWLYPRLGDEMLMVPSQNKKISDIVRHHETEFSRNHFGLLKGY
jgi:hypothetical protein